MTTTVNPDIRSTLLQSEKFKRWRPAESKPFGTGKSASYVGKTFKNKGKAPIDKNVSDSALREPTTIKPTEKHYTVADVSSLWGISEDLVRDIFRDETSVLRIRRPATKMKRAYSTLRIPESTLNRVYFELSKAS